MPSSDIPPRSGRWSSALGGIAEAFGDRNFRRYSVGSIVSWLSFFVQAVAVSWETWELTRSTEWLAAVALLDVVPMAILSPLGGVLAARYDRFRLLFAAYALAALQSAALAAIAFSGHLTISAIAALTLCHGVIHAVSVPAAFGLLPRFVARERLPASIAVSSAYTQLGYFVGPALAGWVLLHFGAAAAFASNAAGYGVYLGCAATMRAPPGTAAPPREVRSFVPSLLDGIRAIFAHRGLQGLLALAVAGDALSAAVRQMMPAFAGRTLGGGVEGLSALLAAAGLGAGAAALWLARSGIGRVRTGVILWAALGAMIATAGLALAPTLPLAALAMAARGFCVEACGTATLSLLQLSVPDELRGRLMSAQFFLRQGSAAVGVAAVGVAGETLGLRAPLLAGAGLALLAWLLVARGRGRLAAAFEAPK